MKSKHFIVFLLLFWTLDNFLLNKFDLILSRSFWTSDRLKLFRYEIFSLSLHLLFCVLLFYLSRIVNLRFRSLCWIRLEVLDNNIFMIHYSFWTVLIIWKVKSWRWQLFSLVLRLDLWFYFFFWLGWGSIMECFYWRFGFYSSCWWNFFDFKWDLWLLCSDSNWD